MEQNMNMGAQTPAESKPVGTIISIVVIVLIIAFGAYYFLFLKQVPVSTETETLTPAEAQADQAISALSAQGTSTDLNDIQKDLDATSLSGLDAGLSDITI